MPNSMDSEVKAVFIQLLPHIIYAIVIFAQSSFSIYILSGDENYLVS